MISCAKISQFGLLKVTKYAEYWVHWFPTPKFPNLDCWKCLNIQNIKYKYFGRQNFQIWTIACAYMCRIFNLLVSYCKISHFELLKVCIYAEYWMNIEYTNFWHQNFLVETVKSAYICWIWNIIISNAKVSEIRMLGMQIYAEYWIWRFYVAKFPYFECWKCPYMPDIENTDFKRQNFLIWTVESVYIFRILNINILDSKI
jgi:hypothetical protein